MTARCPEGHLTRSTDFCDVCGEPVPAQLSPNRLPEGRRVMGNRSANRRDQPLPGRNALGRPATRPAPEGEGPEPQGRQRPQEWLQGQPGRPGERPVQGPTQGPRGLGRRPVQRPEQPLRPQDRRPGRQPEREPVRPQDRQPVWPPRRAPERRPEGPPDDGRRPYPERPYPEPVYRGPSNPEPPYVDDRGEPAQQFEDGQYEDGQYEDGHVEGQLYQGDYYEDEYDDAPAEGPVAVRSAPQAPAAPLPAREGPFPGRPVVEPRLAPELTVRQQPPSRPERPAPEVVEPPAEAYEPDQVDVVSWVADVWIDAEWYASQHGDAGCPPEGVVDVVPLVHSPVLIGRRSRSRGIVPDVDCGPDHGASRRHAELSTDGERWWVVDVGSANGTFVGYARQSLPKQPIPAERPVEIHPGDRIYVGAWTRIEIRPANPDETDPASFERAWADEEDGYDEAQPGGGQGYDDQAHDQHGYDQHGYDQHGYDQHGYDGQGYDQHGFNEQGYDEAGYQAADYDDQPDDSQPDSQYPPSAPPSDDPFPPVRR